MKKFNLSFKTFFVISFIVYILPLTIASNIWEIIEEYENKNLENKETQKIEILEQLYAKLIDDLIPIVESSTDYKSGTLTRQENGFLWENTDGILNGYFPKSRAIKYNDKYNGKTNTEDYAYIQSTTNSGTSSGVKVSVFQPFRYEDPSFQSTFPGEGTRIAEAFGGESKTYIGNEATIDAIAAALEKDTIIIFDSHGGELEGNSGTYYLTLSTNIGITKEERESIHYIEGGGFYGVDGTIIANHMKNKANHNFLWMNICGGMSTDVIAKPLHDKGVEIVYGYSNSVSADGAREFGKYFFDYLIEGHSVGESIDYMKTKANCDWDPSYKGLTFKEIKGVAAFPIVVSNEDTYPGKDKVNNFQEPKSTWNIDTWLAYNTKRDLNEKCYVKSENKFGVCVYKDDCKMLGGQKGNAKSYPGSCTGSTDIQCCIKTVTTLKDSTKLANEGSCKNIKDCPTNSPFISFTQYSNECPGNKDIKLCVPNEYFFAIGVRRYETYTDIKNNDWVNLITYIIEDKTLKDLIIDKDNRIDYVMEILNNLKNNEKFEKLENIMNLRNIGFYLGTNEYGTIFEFKGNKWTVSNHKLEKNKNGGLVKPNDPNEWDWVTLNKTGYTYKSPDALAKTLDRNFRYFKYFDRGSYNLLCNNRHDFAYWCLKILRDEDMFVKNDVDYTIDYIKDFFTIIPPNSNKSDAKKVSCRNN